MIIALALVHEKFGVWIKAVPKSLQRRFNVLSSAHEKFGVWTGPKTTRYESRRQSKTLADSFGGGYGRLIVSEKLIKVFLLQPI